MKQKNVGILGEGPSDFYRPLKLGKVPDPLYESVFNWFHENRNKWDQINLLNCLPDQFEYESLVEKFNSAGYSAKFDKANGFFFVDTTGSYDDFFESFIRPRNKDLLKDLRRIEREEHQLRVEKVSEEIFKKLKEVLELYSNRRKSLGQRNTYEDQDRMGFVQDVLDSYEKQGKAELSLLKDREQNTWAFQLDWIIDGVRYHWNHAYNEDYKKYSPGKILLLELLKESFQNPNIVECNHMRGLAGYKSKLADQSQNLYRLSVHNPYSRTNRLRRVYHDLSRVKTVLKPG